MRDDRCELTEATPKAGVQKVFAWYAGRLLRKRFAAVRCAPGTVEAIRGLADVQGPALLAMSHASWWDPIVASYLWRAHLPGRATYAPMDARELARFRFMRKLGLFGIDPDDRRSLPLMLEYLGRVVAKEPQSLLLITPQGRFTDPRQPMVVRPGAAAIASRLGVRHAVALAVEYTFWNDAKPEVFLRAMPIEAPTAASTAAWQGAIAETMRVNGERLAELVIARDPKGFEELVSREARVHPVYDLWLRLTGRGRGIATEHRGSLQPRPAFGAEGNR